LIIGAVIKSARANNSIVLQTNLTTLSAITMYAGYLG